MNLSSYYEMDTRAWKLYHIVAGSCGLDSGTTVFHRPHCHSHYICVYNGAYVRQGDTIVNCYFYTTHRPQNMSVRLRIYYADAKHITVTLL